MNLESKLKKAIYVAAGLAKSNNNLIIFKDDPEVWYQYYLGLHFGVPTVIVFEKKDKDIVSKLKHDLIIHFMEVDSLETTNPNEIAEKVSKLIKNKRDIIV